MLFILSYIVGGGFSMADRFSGGGASLSCYNIISGTATRSMGNMMFITITTSIVVSISRISLRFGFSEDGGGKEEDYQKLFHVD